MSLEALWTVTFTSLEEGEESNLGAGVVIFESGKIFGGDNQFYYIGDYKYDNSKDIIQGNVKVINYTGEAHSIFGTLRKFDLSIEGELKIPEMTLSGYVVGGDTSKRILIFCVRREELP